MFHRIMPYWASGYSHKILAGWRAEVMMYRDSYRKLKKGFALLIAVCLLTVMIPEEALAGAAYL